MADYAKGLLKAGFMNDTGKKKLGDLEPKERDKIIKGLSDDEADSMADAHWVEIGKDQMYMSDFPRPTNYYRLVYESYQISLEETYFWMLDYLRDGVGYAIVDKITDVFTPSEYSAFGGVAQQRISMQQEKVSQFMHTIAKLIRELFQLVRELRVLDERLVYYKDSEKRSNRNFTEAHITLKGTYVDLVEGGAKSPSSVYGMSREVQFTTLPDLFFMTNVENADEIPQVMEKMAFNRKVKEVLSRKIYSYMKWREMTFKELASRRKFTLQFLRQHFDVILMYMAWIKPYLKVIKRMQSDQRKSDMPDIIGAFEGAVIETEYLARTKPAGNKNYYAVIDIHMQYRVRPSLNYNQEHYQRGPIHVGRAEIFLRSYTWTEDHIKRYKQYREDEAFNLVGMMDKNIQDAMDYLGDELKNYLVEAGEPSFFETRKEEEKVPARKPGEFGSIFAGLAGIFTPVKAKKGKPKAKKKKSSEIIEEDNEKKKARGMVEPHMWWTYKNYKKAHKMIAW